MIGTGEPRLTWLSPVFTPPVLGNTDGPTGAVLTGVDILAPLVGFVMDAGGVAGVGAPGAPTTGVDTTGSLSPDKRRGFFSGGGVSFVLRG